LSSLFFEFYLFILHLLVRTTSTPLLCCHSRLMPNLYTASFVASHIIYSSHSFFHSALRLMTPPVHQHPTSPPAQRHCHRIRCKSSPLISTLCPKSQATTPTTSLTATTYTAGTRDLLFHCICIARLLEVVVCPGPLSPIKQVCDSFVHLCAANLIFTTHNFVL
jgi:hypothetical protein